MMSTTRRRGPWQVGTQHKAFALMGGVVLDLREAIVADQEVTINASVVMGSVDVLVDEHTVVICDGRAFMGDYSESRSRIHAPRSPIRRSCGCAGAPSWAESTSNDDRGWLRRRASGTRAQAARHASFWAGVTRFSRLLAPLSDRHPGLGAPSGAEPPETHEER